MRARGSWGDPVLNTFHATIDGIEGLSVVQIYAHIYHTVNSNIDKTINGVRQSVFSTMVDNDAYTFGLMLKQPATIKCVKAMLVTTAVHEKRNHWSVVLSKDMSAGAKTIMSSWSSKQKQIPDGQTRKYKARLCAHNGMQS